VKITLCTIGFTGKTAEEFFRLLVEAGVKKVVDVRESRIGQLSGFAKYPDIEFFLRRVGDIAYVHEPLFAPSEEIRKAYRKSKNWPAYEAAFLPLMRERRVPKRIDARAYAGTVALLCSEPGPEQCHRRLVAELLAKRWGEQGHDVEVKHLVLPGKTKKGRAKKIETK
jgi:uncharacterized protein (DUF488 family)